MIILVISKGLDRMGVQVSVARLFVVVCVVMRIVRVVMRIVRVVMRIVRVVMRIVRVADTIRVLSCGVVWCSVPQGILLHCAVAVCCCSVLLQCALSAPQGTAGSQGTSIWIGEEEVRSELSCRGNVGFFCHNIRLFWQNIGLFCCRGLVLVNKSHCVRCSQSQLYNYLIYALRNERTFQPFLPSLNVYRDAGGPCGGDSRKSAVW